MRKTFILALFTVLSFTAFSQTGAITEGIYPTHWWVGMKNPNLQIMVHQTDIGKTVKSKKFSSGYKIANGVTLKEIHTAESPNYIFLDLVISAAAKAGTIHIPVAEQKEISFELLPRRSGNGITYAQGVRSQDFIYLIMPDRFANGDYSNDHVAGMKDQSLNRDSI